MRVTMAFDKTGLPLELPEGYDYRLLEARSAAALPDAVAALNEGLDHPIGVASLREMAQGKRSAAISVCDITRPAPNQLVLPLVLRRLAEAGIPAERTYLCIATGLHRPATDGELDEILGAETAARYPVINHNARLLEDHRHLGATSTGTPVYIDRRFIDADLHITLGFIEPHLMLGFSGGRKLIAPGLAAQETIKVLHSPRFMRDARAVEGSVEDNPLHRELLEIARLARHDFLVDVALTRTRQIAGVFAGHPEQAHATGMRFVSQVMLEELPQPVDAVITSSAGYPLDLTFYQAIKGITAAQHVLKPGGRILLVGACNEGAGAPEFQDMLRLTPDHQEFLTHLLHNPVVIDQWQLEKLALVADKADIHFYTPGLPETFHPALWGRAYSTPQAAVQAFFADLPPQATVAVLPEGPYVLARAQAVPEPALV